MTDDLTDRAAQAAREKVFYRGRIPWKRLGDRDRQIWRDAVRAVAKVILTAPPSEGMRKAWDNPIDDECDDLNQADEDWRRMSAVRLAEMGEGNG